MYVEYEVQSEAFWRPSFMELDIWKVQIRMVNLKKNQENV